MSLPASEGLEGISIGYSEIATVYHGAGFMGLNFEIGTGVPQFTSEGFMGISIEVMPYFIHRLSIVNVGSYSVNNRVITDLVLHHPSESSPLSLSYDNENDEVVVNESFGHGPGAFTVSYTVTFQMSSGLVVQNYSHQMPEIVFGN